MTLKRFNPFIAKSNNYGPCVIKICKGSFTKYLYVCKYLLIKTDLYAWKKITKNLLNEFHLPSNTASRSTPSINGKIVKSSMWSMFEYWSFNGAILLKRCNFKNRSIAITLFLHFKSSKSRRQTKIAGKKWPYLHNVVDKVVFHIVDFGWYCACEDNDVCGKIHNLKRGFLLIYISLWKRIYPPITFYLI